METQGQSPRTCILVLGMHRSGTSALAGLLSYLGVDAPATLMPTHTMNPKGFFESQRVYDLHEQILAAAGSSWNDWRPVSTHWLDSSRAQSFQRQAADVLDEEFGGSNLFVLKDPRSCRLVTYWRRVFEALAIAPRVVHVHRNPLEVAASLQARDGMEPEYAHLLWLRHVLDAEYYSRGLPRIFVEFSQVLNDWQDLVRKLAVVGVSCPPFSAAERGVSGFLTPSLKHHQQEPGSVRDNPSLSSWLRDTFAILEAWAASGEDEQDHAKLDAIRTTLNAAVPAFHVQVRTARDAARAIAAQEQETASLQSSLAELQSLEPELQRLDKQLRLTSARLDEVSRHRDQLEALLAIERANAKDREDTLTRTRVQLGDLDVLSQAYSNKIDEQSNSAETARQIIADLNAELGQRDEDIAALKQQLAEQLALCEQITSSSSWRWTAPLRDLSAPFKRR
nr:hypothetical protein [Pseudomonas sp.]